MDEVTTSVLRRQRLIKDYNKQIVALQQQLADRLNQQQLPSGEIMVNVSAEKPVNGRIAFSYVVSNAGWYPSYDIRVDDIKKPVNIDYKANVFQNTGIDWNGVKLSFSNATPWVAGDIPVINPWFIDFNIPAPILYRGRAAGNAPAKLEKEESVQALSEVMEVSPIPVEKQNGETTVTFDISIPYTIKSDGKMQTVEIQRLSAPADYKYVAAPKLSEKAYLAAYITDWAKLSLQTGEATLYFENSFVGKSTLNVNQLSDSLTVSLGTDNSLLVKREKRKDFTTRKVLGQNKTDMFSFLITVRNNKPTPVSITVNDQIPVSSNSSINVDAVELTGGKLNSLTGVVKWEFGLNAGETKQLILTYSVKYPKDKNIILE
jgi:uncharacterized protein (TIGR02231 family)